MSSDPNSLASPSDAEVVDYSGGDQDLRHTSRTFWVGGAGDLALVLPSGVSVTLTNLYVGWHDVQANTVVQTGSTATGVVAFF